MPNQERRYERIPTNIYHDAARASEQVAKEIATAIRNHQAQGKQIVLGLATGSTPTGVYNELVRLHREEGLSFKNVITFNLDEYYPMPPDSLQSYVRFMNEYLFDHVDIDRSNVHIPDGTVPPDEVDEYCRRYEHQIRTAGGIDLQLLGIGRTGHIGFNEPGSRIDSRTRKITLDHLTLLDAASDFFGEEYVPRTAITMGIGTIIDAKRIIIMAWGEGKAPIVREAVEGEISVQIPATFLQNHTNASFILDRAAAGELTREKTPWRVGTVEWTDRMIRRAVILLSKTVGKPILKLVDRDYNEHGMGSLVSQFEGSYDVNLKVFNELRRTITGWPGGKPGTDDRRRPERAEPFPKRVIVFSPHPDDDVISMGGTLQRLVNQGHEVNVAYQTSGNIAVFDDDAIRFLDFVRDYEEIFGVEHPTAKHYEAVFDFIKGKSPGQVDSLQLQQIKGSIRRGEARAACRFVGIHPERVHFQNLPFYETGAVKKKPLGAEDVDITLQLLRDVRPHQIYAAGDLSDPHGTHRVCLQAIFEALDRAKAEGDDWYADCWTWLYRGAWQEWDIDQIHLAVPLSPDEVMSKRKAIFKHQSQKDRPLFPGADVREFWQRAEERNKHTAEVFDQLGMAEYAAMEVFVRYDPGDLESIY